MENRSNYRLIIARSSKGINRTRTSSWSRATRLSFRSPGGVVNGLKTIGAMALALVLWGPYLRAQNQQAGPRSVSPASPARPISAKQNDGYGQPPVPAGRGVSRGRDLRGNDPSQAEPDQHTLASVEDAGVGSLE